MPRPGLYKSDVKQAREELIAQGRRASVDAVRVSLGNTGSKSTIHKYLKELEKDEGASGENRANTTAAIRHLVDELAAKLHIEANERSAAHTVEQEARLRKQAGQIEQLQQEVEWLNAQLRGLAAQNVFRASGVDQLDGLPGLQRPGFGKFHSLVQNDRAGVPGFSRFDQFFNSRASVTSAGLLEQGEDVFWRI